MFEGDEVTGERIWGPRPRGGRTPAWEGKPPRPQGGDGRVKPSNFGVLGLQKGPFEKRGLFQGRPPGDGPQALSSTNRRGLAACRAARGPGGRVVGLRGAPLFLFRRGVPTKGWGLLGGVQRGEPKNFNRE